MGQIFLKGAAAGLLVCCFTSAHADTDSLLMTYSFDSLKGNFGQTQETKAKAFTLGATYVTPSYRASIFVPYISLEGPGTFVNGTVTNSSNQSTRKESGLGDVLTTLSTDFIGGPTALGWTVGATGLLKLPVGNEDKGLGTGKTDYAAQGDFAYRFKEGFSLNGNYGRQIYGKSSTVQLKDGNYYGLGFGISLSNALNLNFNATKRDAIVAGGQDRKERTISGVYAFGPTSALQVGYTKGYSIASPDKAFSASLIFQQ